MCDAINWCKPTSRLYCEFIVVESIMFLSSWQRLSAYKVICHSLKIVLWMQSWGRGYHQRICKFNNSLLWNENSAMSPQVNLLSQWELHTWLWDKVQMVLLLIWDIVDGTRKQKYIQIWPHQFQSELWTLPDGWILQNCCALYQALTENLNRPSFARLEHPSSQNSQISL